MRSGHWKRPTRPTQHHDRDTDGGYTLIELILVVLILGILAAVVSLTITGMRTEAAESGCDTDVRQLGVAVEAYFAEQRVDTIPASGTDHDRFERTLVDSGLLRAASTLHDLDAAGVIIPQEPSSC